MSDEKEPITPAEEPKIKKESKARSIMIWATVIASVIVIGVICYIYLYRQPAIAKGDEAIAPADRAAMEQNDSLALQLYEKVAANNGFYAGDRAKLEAAELLYSKGDYKKALQYVEDYSPKDKVVGALAYGLKGDCLVNLDRNSDAISAYDKAISQSDNNPQLVPYFLGKKATVLMAEKKNAEAAEILRTIENKYPAFAAQNGIEARRVQAESTK